jgi:hypothetical protein
VTVKYQSNSNQSKKKMLINYALQELRPGFCKTFQMSIFDKDTYPSVEEIEILIQEGMDINSVVEKELTPLLHLADPKRNESENLFEIFRILIQNGADINCIKEQRRKECSAFIM